MKTKDWNKTLLPFWAILLNRAVTSRGRRRAFPQSPAVCWEGLHSCHDNRIRAVDKSPSAFCLLCQCLCECAMKTTLTPSRKSVWVRAVRGADGISQGWDMKGGLVREGWRKRRRALFSSLALLRRAAWRLGGVAQWRTQATGWITSSTGGVGRGRQARRQSRLLTPITLLSHRGSHNKSSKQKGKTSCVILKTPT